MAELGLAFLNPIREQQQIEQSEAMAPLLRAQSMASTNHLNALTDQAQYGLQTERNMAALTAQRLGTSGMGGDGNPPSVSSIMLDQAQMWSAAGNPTKAQKAYQEATVALGHETTQAVQAGRLGFMQSQARIKLADKAANLLGEVGDQAGWDQFNANVERVTGQPSPWAKYPYDPSLVESLKADALSAKDKVAIEQRDAAAAERARVDDARISNWQTARRLQQERNDIAARRAEVMKKSGGTDVGAPAAGEVKAARAMILNETPGLPDGDADRAAFDVAAQARGLRKSNPGMTADEALSQTVQAKKASGDLNPATPGQGWFGTGAKPPAYEPPVALPSSGKASDLVVGKKYRNSTGKVARWNGKGWEPVVGGPSGPAPRVGGSTRAAAPPPPVDPEEE